MSFDHEGWIPAFLDGYAADTNPDKRLDFVRGTVTAISTKATGYRSYVFSRTIRAWSPISVPGSTRCCGNAESRLISRHSSPKPEIYPGPAFDDPDPSRNDWVRQAPGLTSIHYWYAEQPDIYPFHWTVRHDKEGRKDQLVTLRGEGESSPVETFTPYGNMLLMQSMLGDKRVVARVKRAGRRQGRLCHRHKGRQWRCNDGLELPRNGYDRISREA